MTQERQKQKQGEGESGDETITITFQEAGGVKPVKEEVKKGTTVKQFLAARGHIYGKGIYYKLNNVLLTTDKETGELVDDALLEEDAMLLVLNNFTGGPSQ